MGLTQVSTDGVKNDAITKTKIPANQIEASELADNAVDTNAIANNAVTNGKLSDNAISSAKIANSAVTNSKLGDDSVTGSRIADNAVATEHITNGAVTAAKLASGVQTTINNNADNRVITGSGSANTLNGESNVIIDSSGRLSIGTTDVPGTGVQMDLRKSADNTVYSATSNQPNGLSIFNPSATNGGFCGIQLGSTSSSGHYGSTQLKNISVGDGYSSDFVVQTRHSGTYGERLRVRSSGGICFNGDTAAANALDDYEEGTWSPTCNIGAITIHTAHYVKIGSSVTFQAYITFPSMSGSSTVQITNFPFDVNGGSDYHAFPVNSNANLGGAQIVGQFNDGNFAVFAKPDNTKATATEMSSRFVLFSCTIMTH